MHPVREPIKPEELANGDFVSRQAEVKGKDKIPSVVGKALRAGDEGGLKHAGHEHDSDSEDDHGDLPPVPTDLSETERKLLIMRKLMRKWWRLAGMKGHPNMCSEVGEEFGVHWARGIAPQLEGRITIINEAHV